MDGAFHVGAWLVEPGLNAVSRNGTSIRLEAKHMEVLVCLARHAGESVSKENLIETVWHDTFVSDEVLTRAIFALRRTFEDDAKDSRVIQTIPRRGYRLLAPVVWANGTAMPSPPPSGSARRGSPAKWWVLCVIAGVALALTTLLALNPGGLRDRLLGRRPVPLIRSLAVLPLRNLSDDPAQEYFSYGMTEELITDLAQVSGLKVISHTSVLQYAKSSKSLPQIARELGVDGIVEGAVQRSGNRVRITAQLIYAPEEQHLWAASYDRDLRDALALQSSVAAAIVGPIRTKIASAEFVPARPAHSPSLEAMEDYLQGNYAFERISSGAGYDAYKDAVLHYKRVISEDPDFAPAYVKLTEIYDAAYESRPDQTMPLEHAAIAKALELDPELADAHSMSAQLKLHYDCDLLGAEKEVKEAIRLNPNSAEAHSWFSAYLMIVGRLEESAQESQLAQELDPGGILGLEVLIAKGQYDRVIALQLQHLELHPNDGFAYINDIGLVNSYYLAGKNQESVEALQRAWTLFGFKAIGEGVGKAYAASGYAGALRYSARQMERLYVEGKVYEPNMIAAWYAMAGDKEQALKWIRIDLADNNHCWLGLDRNPDFASFRSDPRFQELVKQAKLH